jgi:hypothetical protein
MIQSIQAGTTSLYNTTTNVLSQGKVSTTTAKTESVAAKEEDSTTQTSSQGDTVTISNAGAQMAAKTFSGQSANSPTVAGLTDNGYTDKQASALSSAASSIGITAYTATKTQNSSEAAAVSSSSSSSSSSESSLSGYTESQLKTMLQNGEITQAEYNAEIQSRQEAESSSDTDESSMTAVASGAEKTE